MTNDAKAAPATGASPDRRARLTLALLAAATVAIVTTETLPVGLLPQMAAAFGVAEGQIGLMVTVYGLVVVVGAVPLSLLIAKVPPRTAVLGVLGVFVVSIAATAASADLSIALAARVVGGAAHAVFYSCSFAMATSAVDAHWKGRAVAIVGAGNALALALGVPAATALGVWLGWRVPFWGAAALLVGILVGLSVSYRRVASSVAEVPSSMRSLLRGIRSWPLARVALTIVLVTGGHFLTYTYIAPILTDAGVPAASVSVVLAVYGVAGIVTVAIAGRFSDTRPRLLLVASIALTVVAFGLLLLNQDSAAGVVVATALLGAAFGAAPVLWQLTAVRAAPAAASIGPAVVNSAFNVGISLGALVGGSLVTRVEPVDLALPSLGLIAAALLLTLRRGWLPRDDGSAPARNQPDSDAQ